MPAITALAGLVPWADEGIRHRLRCDWPMLIRYSRITRSPAYSPLAP
ncbi:MAG: hypothetical protein Q8S18_13390 [Bacteroidales bacterium]|nr:hypothetical protein [Bacteroidales bacterium]